MQNDSLPQLYDTTPIWFWPILWWQILRLQVTFQKLEAAGYTDVFYQWDASTLKFTINRAHKRDVAGDTPLTALAPRMEYNFALAGYMPETLWALHFNFIYVHRAMQRGLGKLRLTPQPPLEPG